MAFSSFSINYKSFITSVVKFCTVNLLIKSTAREYHHYFPHNFSTISLSTFDIYSAAVNLKTKS